jgi:methylmalonyl-CoA mutase C-terminal domain/subunit
MTKRVLLGKLGLDGHDVGAKMVCRFFNDTATTEIYTGLRRSPAEIAAAAVQEDVDAVGVSILSGAHLPLLEKLAVALREADLGKRLWLVGGVIPKEDRQAIRKLGFSGIFPTGSSFDEIADFIRENAP